MSQYPFTTETLDRIIAAAAYSYSFVQSLVRHFTLESLPTDQAKLVLRAALGLADRVHTVTPALLEQELHLLQAPPGEAAEALDYLQTCLDLYGEPTDKDSEELAALLGPMVRREVERKLLEDSVKLYGAGHSIADIALKVGEAQAIGTVTRTTHADLSPDDDLIIQDDHVDTLPTGIFELDARLDGGLEQSGLGLNLCETGGGKSMFLGHVAAWAQALGKNVFIASLEMTENELRSRLARNLLGMTKDQLKDDMEVQRRWKLLVANSPLYVQAKSTVGKMGQMRVCKFDPYVTSVNTIKQSIDRWVHTPDLVIVDYIGRLKSNRSKGAMTELNPRDLAMAMQELFNLARELNGWAWTAQQINRESEKRKNGPGVNNTAGSKEMATIASVIISMDMGPDLKEQGQAHFRVIKNRHGASSAEPIQVVTDLDKARVEARGERLW